MGTIHDRYKKESDTQKFIEQLLDDQSQNIQSTEVVESKEDDSIALTEESVHLSKNEQEIQSYLTSSKNALSMVDDIILKSYLTNLTEMDILAPPTEEIGVDVILYKINKMVYEKDEFATDKFISVISAMTFADCSVFLIVDGHSDHTDFYLGVKNNNENKTTRSVSDTFCNSIKGQFPGIIIEDYSIIEKEAKFSKQYRLLNRINEASSMSSFVGIPAYKNEKGSYTNTNYIQGVEKLAIAMQGKTYTAVILATNLTPITIRDIRNGYETLYTQLSSVATQQLAYSTNESLSDAISRSHGVTTTSSQSISNGTTHTTSKGSSHSKTTSKSRSTGESKQNIAGKGGQLGSTLLTAGAALTLSGAAAPVGIVLMGAGITLGLGGVIDGKSKSENESTSKSRSKTKNKSTSHGTSHNETETSSKGESLTDTEGRTLTAGHSRNYTLTVHNKHIEELLKRIDKQLQRIEMSESTGLWSSGAYFFSYENDLATAETGAAIFKSIMQGESSGIETSAINTWYKDDTIEQNKFSKICASVTNFIHPSFSFNREGVPIAVNVEGSSLINSKELAMMLGLPHKSVPGLPVVEYASLAKEIVRHNTKKSKRAIEIGCIFDQGIQRAENTVGLDAKSLTQHTFVTGSTGCGKSETVYKLITEAKSAGANFLIIEPAKGEYKTIFGKANIFGTNPLITKLLRINPFLFPKGIHVLEHIDRLTEIFNVCWPMYAAMPAVLKKAMLKAYENSGWDLIKSNNEYSDDIFPSFVDLLNELENAINQSAYSEEIKGNYTGSLITRVESLTNGINGEIFSANEIPNKVLFDEDTIVDLSRVGSQETKALIMGILIMRLSEYRMVRATSANAGLKHLTVLEEAHNLLKRTSTEQTMEGSNVTGKSVEMITNAIAEMRTYGEGFVIVDQSPTSVDQTAIKNTNTKVIMRLPDGDDRKIAGKAAAMKENQIDEIAKLPTGVAVVYQNDWIAPVLAKINMFTGERIMYEEINEIESYKESKTNLSEVIKLLLKGRVSTLIDPSLDEIEQFLAKGKLSTSQKIQLRKNLNEFRETGKLSLWEDSKFAKLSTFITDLLMVRKDVERMVNSANNFNELNDHLSSLIAEKASAPSYLNLALRQCLMKDYGETNETRAKIYNAWFYETQKSLL